MRADPPPPDLASLLLQIEAAPGMARVRALSESFAAAAPNTVAAILEEAAKFAQAYLTPLNTTADVQGCRLLDGRVHTAPGHKEAWTAFVEAGWPTLNHPETQGGQGLPLILATAVQQIFDRACPAFGMLPVPQRSAFKLIAAHGDAAMQATWLPRLASGEWGATICISEAEAGSDVGRIRTLAVPSKDGAWAITGEKCWISFGDHDLSTGVVHCLLARTPGAPAGGGGLSLFLAPDQIEDADGGRRRNGVVVRRLEDKLGLHASPTCALGFEGATGWMIGADGRGLAQMFVMITNMRLSVGVQGLGIASACADLAAQYAAERRQGGPPHAPIPIAEHPDIQRELMQMSARVEVLTGLALAVANFADLAAHETQAEAKQDAAALVQWLLPILKTTGGEYAFDVASGAIQVLGGAGYTRDWPMEQALRDARVLTIFEGATGIQGLDLLHRRLLRGDGRGLAVFKRLAREAQAALPEEDGARFSACLDALDAAAAWLIANAHDARSCEAGATAFLHLAALAATGWIAARLACLETTSPQARRLAARAGYWLHDIDHRARLLHHQATLSAAPLDRFAAARS
jgi:alkylation response protein AidB-like acyl-CoA dehydrogenase